MIINIFEAKNYKNDNINNNDVLKLAINRLNKQKDDNSLKNLELVTQSENMKHSHGK